MPSANDEEAGTDQAAPERVAVKLCTVVAPCLTTTLKVGLSPTAVPAVPVNVGVGLFDVLAFAGAVTATPAGDVESMVKVVAALVPTFESALVCDAVTV